MTQRGAQVAGIEGAGAPVLDFGFDKLAPACKGFSLLQCGLQIGVHGHGLY